MRIVFMGTPRFALPTLEALLDNGYQVPLVVSQPERPAGRGRAPSPPPVAAFARERGLPLFQPESLRPAEAVARVRDACPDLVVVVAFGLLLRPEVLILPALGCINVHASLLPRHRGASPIQAAILAGDVETGVCLMKMDEGLDTGPVLACRNTAIEPRDDALTLAERLSHLGSDLLIEAIPSWAVGGIEPQSQDGRLATFARRIEREDARLDWSLPSIDLWRRVRAYRGWPDAFTTWNGKVLKVLSALPGTASGGSPGTIMLVDDGGIARPAVATGDGVLVLGEVALEGRQRMDAVQFARGQREFVESRLGS